MSEFPHPQANVRAPRVHIGKPVSFSIAGKQISAVLQVVSTTGGLAQLARPLPSGTFAELAVDTNVGRVCGLVEFLQAKTRKNATQAFRFIAFSDEDYERLNSTIELAKIPKP